jgi:hypothetical protein
MPKALLKLATALISSSKKFETCPQQPADFIVFARSSNLRAFFVIYPSLYQRKIHTFTSSYLICGVFSIGVLQHQMIYPFRYIVRCLWIDEIKLTMAAGEYFLLKTLCVVTLIFLHCYLSQQRALNATAVK